jgi:hypothetical protein
MHIDLDMDVLALASLFQTLYDTLAINHDRSCSAAVTRLNGT